MPIKLIILASDFLSKQISKALNNCITSHIFPGNAKVVTVVPIDNKTDDKYVVSNYGSVNLLNGFSKIYQNTSEKSSCFFHESTYLKFSFSLQEKL